MFKGQSFGNVDRRCVMSVIAGVFRFLTVLVMWIVGLFFAYEGVTLDPKNSMHQIIQMQTLSIAATVLSCSAIVLFCGAWTTERRVVPQAPQTPGSGRTPQTPGYKPPGEPGSSETPRGIAPKIIYEEPIKVRTWAVVMVVLVLIVGSLIFLLLLSVADGTAGALSAAGR
jgi:hypothetical protein